MKKLILLLALFINLTIGLRAQQFSNTGFEQWDTIGDYTQPSHWFTLNKLVQFGLEPSTMLATNAHSGNYAVLLESKSSPFADYSGVLCTGPILNDLNEPDFSNIKIPFNYAPIKFRCYFKAMPMPNDKGVLGVYLTKWNATTMQTDTVAEAGLEFANTVSEFTLAEVPFVYHQKVMPDSAFLIVSSSEDGFNPVVGSKLWLDDLELVYPAAGLMNKDEMLVKTYPNPATNVLHVNTAQRLVEIEMLNTLGEVVLKHSLVNYKAELDVQSLPNGMYILYCNDVLTGNRSSIKIIKQ